VNFEAKRAVSVKAGVHELVEGLTGTMFLQNSLNVKQTARRHPVRE
jgi:hypothetical protein